MRYCAKCGNELGENDKFCPKCGTPVQATVLTYRKERDNWGVGRIFAVIFGGLFLLVAFGLLIGGVVMIFGQTTFTDREGYIMSRPADLTVSSYAIVQSDVDVHMDEGWMMRLNSQDIVTIRMQGYTNNGKPIFIGIARRSDAQNYLNGVNYDRIIEYPWRYGQGSGGITRYTTIQGGSPSSPPIAQSFWVAQASGAGTQTLNWNPASGEYWVVAMNADGSKLVDVTLQLGAKVTVLSWVGYGLLIGGIIAALVGGFIIYTGIRRY